VDLLLSILWFLVPAGFANAFAPVAAKLLPHWNWPLDFNRQWRGQRIFGSHKTIRGIIVGVIAAYLIHQVQRYLAMQYESFQSLSISESYYAWWVGVWMGFSAMMGDAIKSFFKRQKRIAPGHSWHFWDQADWVIGTILGCCWFIDFQLIFVVGAILLGVILSFTGHIVEHGLKITKKWV
jgi:CDP-2,3-bis-(O-geranylgeranyl)-sn-glycerol synthase